MTWDLVAIALGLVVGLSLGALGGGGSALAVPILVFVAGMQAQDATSASLLVVGIASAIGAVRHVRNGNVRLAAGLGFGAAGVVGSRIGTIVNRSMDEEVLLVAFSVLVLYVAARMYRSVTRPRPVVAAATAPVPPTGPSISPGGVALAVDTPPATSATRFDRSPQALAKLAAAATAVGVLTGLFGVGGGFAVVPALTLLLGFGTKEAIGTSLVVIAFNAAVALAMRSGDLGFDWGIVAPFLATVTTGVLLGSSVAHRIAAERLTRGFAVMLAVVAVSTAVGALAA